MLRNTVKSFGSLTKLFHWSLFILICAQFYLVWGRDFLSEGSATRGQYILLHKSFGVTVLILSILFVLWRNMNKKPNPPPLQSHWKHVAAISVHHLLLTLMILIPILGYLMVCTAGKTLSFFDLFHLPNLISKNKALGNIFFQAHQKLAYLFLILIGIHIAAALHHHFILKDNVLKRMLPFTSKDKKIY